MQVTTPTRYSFLPTRNQDLLGLRNWLKTSDFSGASIIGIFPSKVKEIRKNREIITIRLDEAFANCPGKIPAKLGRATQAVRHIGERLNVHSINQWANQRDALMIDAMKVPKWLEEKGVQNVPNQPLSKDMILKLLEQNGPLLAE
ncbi:hypothetical protein [Paludibacterium paludis]|uniref:Uncharacterized protein n=1 Tax=Paludibacterium paludis TaxID=1225769 RepID=A0A918P112_9NEIS|nr:hypothetical protein [Paludibacterium paludis]GGY12375.1 hypothetical protein GCM10011289_14390 [Paludibacterium paludis]